MASSLGTAVENRDVTFLSPLRPKTMPGTDVIIFKIVSPKKIAEK
jgi:hypothetical protein